jgi:glycine hydroxymethyltransferase
MFQLDHLLTIWLVQWPRFLNKSLAEVDPELNDIIEKEKNRQWKV